jgi:serine protease DegS
MAGSKNTLVFVMQSALIGLGIAFVIVTLRPEWIGRERSAVAPRSYSEAVEVSSPAVANVFTERVLADRQFGQSSVAALGSAVVIDPRGYLITNYHVVADAAQIQVQLADGRVTVPAIVGVDPDTELALLRIDLPDLPSIRLGRSDTLEVGDVVLAIGNSLGLSHTVTMGIVSATGRGQLNVATYEDFIQTDAAINVGNSGGALINTAGELIGINTAIIGGDRMPPEGIGFAIPVNLVRGVMSQLIEHGRVIRGYLGVGLRDLPAPVIESSAVDGDAVMIVSTVENGPAASAGMQPGDILTHVAGRRVTSVEETQNIVAASAPGDRVPLRYVRQDGTVIETVAILEEREPYLPESGS